ncbi:MAG: aminomethyltransferase [Planctomycetota bacterium]|nr:MAG: aminomethyltransferase [Planctomycetota bacterium]
MAAMTAQQTGARAGQPAAPRGYWAWRQSAACFEEPGRGMLLVRGADRVEFLQKLLTNDVARLAEGAGCAACLLNPKARLLAPMRVYREPEQVLVELPAVRAAAIAEQLRRLVFLKKVEIEDASARWRIFGLEGPRAGAALARALGTQPPALAAPLAIGPAVLGGQRVRLVRRALVGEGWRIHVEGAGAEAVAAALRAAAEAEGGETAEPAALELVRIEVGEEAWGAELDEETFLPETALAARAVSHTKGCYPGQEPVARVHFKGRTHRMLGAVVARDAAAALAPGMELFLPAGGKAAGRLTSTAFSPSLGRPIALGYLRREVAEPGTELGAGEPTGPVVEVRGLPLVGGAGGC